MSRSFRPVTWPCATATPAPYPGPRVGGAERRSLGLSLGEVSGRGRAGRKLSFTTRVQFNGNLLIGKACIAQLDFKPGDEFEIKVGRKQIRLVRLGVSDDEE